jgi:hypothetical protein
MTLFDQAELSSVANTEVLFDGLTIDLDDPVGVLVLAAQVLQGWKPSMPVHSVWADNYISYVGFYLPNTFNIALQKAAGIWGFDANAAHGYPMVWYSKSIVTPTDTALGFQQSFEYDLKAGLPSSTFPASDFQLGDAYHQIAGSSDPLALEPLPPEDVFQAIVPLFGNKADVVVKGTVAVVQFAGDVAVAVANEAAQTDQMISQGYNYVANAAEEGASAAANLFDSAVLHLTLHTRPPSAPQSGNGLVHPNLPDPSGNGTNTPAMAWVPVQIPANALAMAFDFTGSGDPVQDSLVFGIGETNLFSLQAQYVPTNSVSASRLIDVSAWSGQQVELFFGLMGGTSTNATLEIDNIRFYSLQAPSLTIQDTNGAIALSWPSSAAGYVVESTTSLSSPDWEAVTNVPAITADSYLLTNSYPATATFFRLRSR